MIVEVKNMLDVIIISAVMTAIGKFGKGSKNSPLQRLEAES